MCVCICIAKAYPKTTINIYEEITHIYKEYLNEK